MTTPWSFILGGDRRAAWSIRAVTTADRSAAWGEFPTHAASASAGRDTLAMMRALIDSPALTNVRIRGSHCSPTRLTNSSIDTIA